MNTRYSDYIKIQDFLPVYDILDEKPNMWRTFIPTKQFSDLLQRIHGNQQTPLNVGTRHIRYG